DVAGDDDVDTGDLPEGLYLVGVEDPRRAQGELVEDLLEVQPRYHREAPGPHERGLELRRHRAPEPLGRDDLTGEVVHVEVEHGHAVAEVGRLGDGRPPEPPRGGEREAEEEPKRQALRRHHQTSAVASESFYSADLDVPASCRRRACFRQAGTRLPSEARPPSLA